MDWKSLNFVEYCNTGNVDAVEEALKDPEVNVGYLDNAGLRLASQKGFIEIVKHLMESGRVDWRDKGGYALIYAVNNGHRDIVDYFLSYDNIYKSVFTYDVLRDRNYFLEKENKALRKDLDNCVSYVVIGVMIINLLFLFALV